MTDKFVSEEDFTGEYERGQSKHEYQDRIKDEYTDCKFYQQVNVSYSIKIRSLYEEIFEVDLYLVAW